MSLAELHPCVHGILFCNVAPFIAQLGLPIQAYHLSVNVIIVHDTLYDLVEDIGMYINLYKQQGRYFTGKAEKLLIKKENERGFCWTVL